MVKSINDFQNVFFIGVAGSGMSAIAQYLAGTGKNVSGSDRYFSPDTYNDVRQKLEEAGVKCFLQNGEGISSATDLVVVSTAIEDSVYEVRKTKELNIPIIKRSELLAIIAEGKKTIAVGGTSGKSTTSAMLFEILQFAGLHPSIISGAGLVSIIKEGKIGNAKVGEGEWLVIEADESDGSIVQYRPEIGLLLNIDKDHQEISELKQVFTIFKNNTRKYFVVNQSHSLARELSQDPCLDFSSMKGRAAGFMASGFWQEGLQIHFFINEVPFTLQTVGKHNMENALAATAVAALAGVDVAISAKALANYEGIYRRHQVLGNINGVMLIDDYAHNPAKCAASIAACQYIAPRVIAWFQPHGYGPTRFLRNDFVKEIADVLRGTDEIWMSEIFYAGGTAVKDISANDLICGLRERGCNAFFIEDRSQFPNVVKSHLTENCVLLLMGARDPGLEQYAAFVLEKLRSWN